MTELTTEKSADRSDVVVNAASRHRSHVSSTGSSGDRPLALAAPPEKRVDDASDVVAVDACDVSVGNSHI